MYSADQEETETITVVCPKCGEEFEQEVTVKIYKKDDDVVVE